MKQDIYGKKVYSSHSLLSKNKISRSCYDAERLIDILKKETGIDPIFGLKCFDVYHYNTKPKKRLIMVDLENIRSCMFERREVISEISDNAVAFYYYKNSISFDDSYFHPLDKAIIIHELGHHFHELIDKNKKKEISKLYNSMHKTLVEKIKEGGMPLLEAETMLSNYAFLHEYGLSVGKMACLDGYVGRVKRIKRLSKKSRLKPITAYSFHEDDREFFAEMFMLYFCGRKKLKKAGILNFAEDILTKHARFPCT